MRPKRAEEAVGDTAVPWRLADASERHGRQRGHFVLSHEPQQNVALVRGLHREVRETAWKAHVRCR